MADKDKQEETIPEGTIFVQPRAELLVPDAGGGYRTALYERHPAHPGGEVYIAGPGVVEVAQTPDVMARLAPRLQEGGALVRLEGRALDQARQADALRREQAEQARIVARGETILPAVLEARPSASPEEVAEARERVATLEEQVAKLTERIAQMTTSTTVETGDGTTTEQLAAGAKSAKPGKPAEQ